MMLLLPSDVLYLIFEFDKTYYNIYEYVLIQLMDLVYLAIEETTDSLFLKYRSYYNYNHFKYLKRNRLILNHY